MKKLLILLVALLLVVGCGNKDKKIAEETNSDAKGTVQDITCAKMKNMLDSEKDIVLIDVRTEAEYSENHLSKAINIPNEKIKDIKNHEEITKDTIIIVCKICSRHRQGCGTFQCRKAGAGWYNRR